MENFAEYSHAIAALGFWAILVIVLTALSTMGRSPENRSASGKPVRNYSDPAYRRERAFMNAIEASGPFIAVTVGAILIGASPFKVNLFASIFIVARVAMAIVHIKTEIQPLRSIFWAVAMVTILAQAILVVTTALF
ncbi:MAPEG family protein [Sulfitobacter donghicola]|uniref:Membrane protein n=1 Tax=Sulfitobacter donghicola DSW-25 = KCTC 12864 = JCM 14565 TaxID=1300350 RepID=A0A073IGF7_9RHOB|nr:MAPEG family protein [Sulfitobacter donghicola]KEJ89423.1 membrane protein [Sulfitobacter donghicola DSW-25 = KCTC 12864 = JCM 14565]KIN69243.1 Inner membrane protein [Sulfitobacter donghicola DSW-25 = KCTC 12864 = JCM 14565]